VKRSRRPTPGLVTRTILAVGVTASVAAAQIPDTFTNLQVLPKDIPKPQLVQTMRSFASALGVRCQHCHVGKVPEDLRTFDFASDEKETKKVARAMLRMTREINTRLLPETGRTPLVEVHCITCHHGVAKPEQLVDVLAASARKDGIEAALQKYGELREKHYGRAAYDFGAPSLNTLAERLAGEKNLEGAIAVQEFNLKVNPNIATSYALLAHFQQQKGDRAAARASIEKAIALEPGDAFYKRRLQELDAGRPSAAAPAPSPSPR
jgi:tetratricopeptide (TPR) repeat protein